MRELRALTYGRRRRDRRVSDRWLRSKRPMQGRPTVQNAMVVIAGFGGHVPGNGDVGWLAREQAET